MIGFQYNWTVSIFNPANPHVAFNMFRFPPGFPNITANMDFPNANIIDQEFSYPATGFGFGLYFSIALCLLAVIVIAVKLTLFISFENGIKLSFPQMVLTLCFLASFFCLFFLLFGPQFGCNKLDYGPVSFFQLHYIPYWYGAITLYAFYLAEVSVLTKSSMDGLDKMKYPSMFVIFALYVVELVTASIFAAFPSTVQFPDMVLMLGVVYIISCCLVMLLLGFATVLLFIKMSQSGSSVAMRLRFLISGAALLIFLAMSILLPIFLANGTFQDADHVASSQSLLWIATGGASLFLAMSFRVQTQKEIEMSKSATSSTSGRSGSSGSSNASSSSSQASDPVIEL